MKKAISFFLIGLVGIAAVECSEPSGVAPRDDSQPTTIIPKGMVISNPRPAESSVGGFQISSVSSAASEVAYVSLAPKTLPNSNRVRITNHSRPAGASVATTVDGGFDPVAVEANAGDTLDLVITNSDGSTQPMAVRVPARRPPSVVRSKPSKGLTDVALNVIVTVVFSEPVNQSTVTKSSLQLLTGNGPVPGRIVFLAESFDAQFVPDKPLDANETYELKVTSDVLDLDGDPLESPFISTFVTGTQLCEQSAQQSGCPSDGGIRNSVIIGNVIETTESGTRTLSDAVISSWVQPLTGNGYSPPDVHPDANGQFVITSLPHSTVFLHATAAGFDQPCAVQVHLATTTATGDIEVVSTRKAVMDTTRTLPQIWGLAYELVPSTDPLATWFLQGIPGTRVYVETVNSFTLGSTTADEVGHYAFCNLPLATEIRTHGVKSGFVTVATPKFGAATITLTRLGTLLHDTEMTR